MLGAAEYGEPGVCIYFEETIQDIAKNAPHSASILIGLAKAVSMVE